MDFAFIDFFANVERTVTCSEFCNIWVAIIARAKYISVIFEDTRSEPARAGRITISIPVCLQSFNEIFQKLRFGLQVVAIGISVCLRSLANFL